MKKREFFHTNSGHLCVYCNIVTEMHADLNDSSCIRRGCYSCLMYCTADVIRIINRLYSTAVQSQKAVLHILRVGRNRYLVLQSTIGPPQYSSRQRSIS